MKRSLLTFVLVLLGLAAAGCDSFLEQPPQDQFTDDTYWTSEENVRAFAWGFYPTHFPGYASGFDLSWGGYFTGTSMTDNQAPSSATEFTENVPTAGGGWGFGYVRKTNLFIERVQGMSSEQMDREATEHWVGVGRFFRALEYNDLVKQFGDVPWHGKVLDEDDEALYKKRDPRAMVMDSVLADFRYAVEHVREDDGEQGLTVNRSVVLAMMSRVFLRAGTTMKYHDIDEAKAEEYLQVAKDAAGQVINSGRYALAEDYRSLFNSLSLAGNSEIILYRKYETGVLTHSLNSYSNKEPQAGASKDAFDAYLTDGGLPTSLGPQPQGKTIEEVMANRDPRMRETYVPELRILGIDGNYSTSGYAQHKFLNEEIADEPAGNSNDNPTDAPVIRYGEVLLNYAEASAELGGLTQQDLDMSINALRDRADMPHLQIVGGMPAVNGETYNDPERDSSVPPMIWEIRRERRVELMMEGFRYDDLRRWHKLEYLDTVENPDVNRGAWIDLSNYPEAAVVVEGGDEEGYIMPASEPQDQRRYPGPKVYLQPIPLDQITLYENNGVDLEQNPGW